MTRAGEARVRAASRCSASTRRGEHARQKSKTTKSLHYRRNNRGGGVRNPRSCTAANMFCIILNQAMPDGIRTHFLLTVGAQPREQRRRSVMTLTSCAASWRVCCGRRPIQDSLLRHQLRLALARLLRVVVVGGGGGGTGSMSSPTAWMVSKEGGGGLASQQHASTVGRLSPGRDAISYM